MWSLGTTQIKVLTWLSTQPMPTQASIWPVPGRRDRRYRVRDALARLGLIYAPDGPGGRGTRWALTEAGEQVVASLLSANKGPRQVVFSKK